MKESEKRILAADFETTVYEGQDRTDVWAVGVAELYTDHYWLFHTIEDFYYFLLRQRSDFKIYFHNLKFDGSFLVDFFINKLHLKQSFTINSEGEVTGFKKRNKLYNKEFSYSISDMGQWYSIFLRMGYHRFDFYDSAKLMPLSLAEMGKAFKTKHQKLTMDYEGYRYPGCHISDQEKEYILNDVLVLKESLEIFFSEGHTGITIGSCCLKEFKDIVNKDGIKGLEGISYDDLFPNIKDIDLLGTNAYDYCHKAYKGAFCYLNPKFKGHINKNGIVLDINSMYPYVMHSKSGNRYPYGRPLVIKPDKKEKIMNNPKLYYYIRFKCRFRLKEGKLPTVQIKGNLHYKGNEWLKTSDFYSEKGGKYYKGYEDKNGNYIDAYPTLTMGKSDYELFRENYEVYDFEWIDGIYFYTCLGMFDKYIDKYMEIKINSTGGKRMIAKLFLNNLYGKLSSSDNSSFKYFVKEDGKLKLKTVYLSDKKPVYIPAGAAVTAYARAYIIRSAQENMEHFAYCDTDSMHLIMEKEDVKGLRIHPTELGAWDCEFEFNEAVYVRQKTYLEKSGNDIRLTCAGLPPICKKHFIESVKGTFIGTCDLSEDDMRYYHKLNEEEKEFVRTKRCILDFKPGIRIPGKLLPKRIPGGIVLKSDYFTMKE